MYSTVRIPTYPWGAVVQQSKDLALQLFTAHFTSETVL